MKAVKATRKATSQAHPYRVGIDGCPLPLELHDVPAQSYDWGNVGGLALVVDLFYWRDVLTEQEAHDNVTPFVRSMMETATKELEAPIEELKADHRGVAVGVLEGFAALVDYALQSKDMRSLMEAHLQDLVKRHEEMHAEQLAEEKALALDVHGLALEKGGPRNE